MATMKTILIQDLKSRVSRYAYEMSVKKLMTPDLQSEVDKLMRIRSVDTLDAFLIRVGDIEAVDFSKADFSTRRVS